MIRARPFFITQASGPDFPSRFSNEQKSGKVQPFDDFNRYWDKLIAVVNNAVSVEQQYLSTDGCTFPRQFVN